MALHLNQDNKDERRGALNDLAALAWKWEERARAAERALVKRRAFHVGIYLAAYLAGFFSGVGWSLVR